MLEYLDFDLEIGKGDGRDYPLAVLRSPVGETRAVLHFPFDELALERYQDKLQIALLRSGGRHRLALTKEEQAAQDFGKALFEALFPADVRSCYDRSLERALSEGKGLRLRLRIQPPEMAALPWEYLYDPRLSRYLCLSQNTPLVRYIERMQPVLPLAVNPPLRVLGMIASPSSMPALDVEREKERLECALQPLQESGLATLTWLEGQTWRDLQRALRTGTWHIFHFIGHGGFDPETDEGLLMLADEQGQAKRLSATQLARLLADHASLRLAVLNACEGASGSGLDLFSSTAAILVQGGLLAVLAMQYAITDRAAIELSRSFYEALADGLPVDAALAEARKAISLEIEDSLEWGTPVLYLRATDGVLFNLQAASQRPDRSPAEPELAPKPGEQGHPAGQKPPRDLSGLGGIAPAEVVGTPPLQPGMHKETKVVSAAVPKQSEPAELRKEEKPGLAGKMVDLHQRMTDPDLPPLDLHTFVQIPGLSYPFYIARYPVANVQYQRFVEAEDFADPQHWRSFPKYDEKCQLKGYWGEEGWKWLQENWDQKKKRLPGYWNDSQFGVARRGVPVVGITWYEANAYCKWLQVHWDELDEAVQNPGLRPKLLRLPLEPEWVLAAGGAKPAERYPWDAPGKATTNTREILERANVSESGLGCTTPVGMYPQGASRHGIWDMGGNVWEWQANLYDKDPPWRVVRGGSWSYDEDLARLSDRSYNLPANYWYGSGFRVAVFPS